MIAFYLHSADPVTYLSRRTTRRGKPVPRGKWQDDETGNPLSIVTTQRYVADDDDVRDARRAWSRYHFLLHVRGI